MTAHPTAAWTAQQLRNAFPDDQAPGYLLHDGDGAFAAVATTIAHMNIDAVRTAPRSPWQNAYVERVIGSIRRECLDHVIVAERGRLAPSAGALRRLLHASSHASRAGEGQPRAASRSMAVRRPHRGHTGSRRPASPLRARRRVASQAAVAADLAPLLAVATPVIRSARRSQLDPRRTRFRILVGVTTRTRRPAASAAQTSRNVLVNTAANSVVRWTFRQAQEKKRLAELQKRPPDPTKRAHRFSALPIEAAIDSTRRPKGTGLRTDGRVVERECAPANRVLWRQAASQDHAGGPDGLSERPARHRPRPQDDQRRALRSCGRS